MIDSNPQREENAIFSSSSEVTTYIPQQLRLWDVGGVGRFFQAVVRGDTSLIKERIKVDLSLAKIKHSLGWYPIHVAVLASDIETIKLLLDQPEVSVNTPDESRFSRDSSSANIALRRAELSPRIVESVDTSGATPLHYACLTGDWPTIKVLLMAGASHLLKDESGRLPIHYFDWEGNTQIGETVTLYNRYISRISLFNGEEDTSTTDLFSAIINRKHEVCKEILRKSPDTATDDMDGGLTALLVAVVANNLPAVKMILSTDKDSLNKPDNWCTGNYGSSYRERYYLRETFSKSSGRNSTPLHYACRIGNWEVVEELLNAGADWLRKDENEKTPRDFFDEEMDIDILKMYDSLCRRLNEAKQEKEKVEQEERERERLVQEEREREEKERLPEGAENPDEKEDKDTESNGGTDSTLDNGKKDSEDEDENEDESDSDEKKGSQVIEDSEVAQRNKYRREHPMVDFISAKVIGQRGPIQSLASAIRLRENGWARTNSPLVFLFLGSSGVGKTEIAKQLTIYLNHQPWKKKKKSRGFPYPDSDSDDEGKSSDPLVAIEKSNAFIRLDMSEFQQRHTVQNLTGAPKSYVGYGEGGTLSSKLHKNPEAIVLLDEIEKAHPDVLTVFLQLFDDGRITDSSRGTVHCPNAIFIMTSNLASDQIKQHMPILRFDEKDPMRNNMQRYREASKSFLKLIYPTLKEGFKRDEFLGRINQILIMLPLAQDEVGIIIEKHLKSWSDRTREQHSIQLTWSPEVVKHLSKAYNVHFGARSLAYEVEYVVLRLVAEAQMADEISEGWLVHLVMDQAKSTILMRTSKPQELERRGCRLFKEY